MVTVDGINACYSIISTRKQLQNVGMCVYVLRVHEKIYCRQMLSMYAGCLEDIIQGSTLYGINVRTPKRNSFEERTDELTKLVFRRNGQIF